MKEQIIELTHRSMFAWFEEYFYEYKDKLKNPDNGLEDGKLNFNANYWFMKELPYIKYPYGDVDFFGISETKVMFLINSPIKITKYGLHCFGSLKLLSFKGFPKKVDNYVGVCNNRDEQYSLDYKKNDKYKLYLAMWLELFDSVTEKERWEYINEFKGKKNHKSDYSVIPKEILLEFGVL